MDCQKAKFSLNEGIHYLNGAYMSPLLKSVEEIGIASLKRKSNPYLFNKADFFDSVIELKKLYAQLLNIDNWNQLALIPSVSYGLANAAQNIRPKKKKHILVLSEQFPSNYYVWEQYCLSHNLELKTIEAPDTKENRGAKWNEKILEAINEDTLLLACAHVHWADGTKFLLQEFNQKLKKYGGLLAIDGTQSFGALEFNQSEINADILVASSYKWLLGPYSVGFAYYGDQFLDGQPIEHSWLNRLGSEDFSRLVDYQSEYKSGAQRYEMGEAPNFINIPMATVAAQQLLHWTASNIQSYCKDLVEREIRTLEDVGFWIEEEDFRSSHLFGIRIPARLSMDSVKQTLDSRNIIVSYRGDAIRVSPNVYNTIEDIQYLMSSLIDLAN